MVAERRKRAAHYSKYRIGDVVYGLRLWRDREKIKCSLCHGKQKVSVLEDSTLKAFCPACSGRGYNWSDGTVRWYEVLRLTIGQIRVQVGHEPEVIYMAKETGLGSGTLHKEVNMHDTLELAVAYAEYEGARPYPWPEHKVEEINGGRIA